MAGIAEDGYKNTAECQSRCLTFDSISENARKADHRKRNYIVEQYDCDNTLPSCNIGKRIKTQKLLDDGINECRTESPAHSSAISDYRYRKHRRYRYRAAIGKLCKLYHAQHGGKRYHDSALHKWERSVLCHFLFLLKHKKPHCKSNAVIGKRLI